MGSAIYIMACLLLAADAAEPAPVYMNERNFGIPITIPQQVRGQLRQIILFSYSPETNQYLQEAVATPDNPTFPFYAKKDGVYRFKIATIDKDNNRQPEDIYTAPVRQTVVVDTVKPDVRITSAERRGDEIVVRWEIREDYPKLNTLRLEYRVDGAYGPVWNATTITPALAGEAAFRPGTSAAVAVRMSLSDLAGNEGKDEKSVSGNGGSAEMGAAQNPAPPPLQPAGAPLVPLSSPTPGGDPGWSPNPSNSSAQPVSLTNNPARPMAEAVPASGPPGNGWQNSASAGQGSPSGGWQNSAGAGQGGPSGAQVIASSSGSGMSNPAPYSPAVASNSSPRPQIINRPQVSLEYEVGKYGPSGVGRVDLYITRDDGRSWQQVGSEQNPELPTADDARAGAVGPLTRTLTVNLPDGEGMYGFYLVVHSRAGRGKPPPRSGQPPQLRVEVDLTPPVVQLLDPMADPQRQNAIVLRWSATDPNRHLTQTPIKLQWAEREAGPWQNIGPPELENTGHYSWVPQNVPPHVFLRVIARDAAGHESCAQTNKPVPIDLSEPEIVSLRLAGSAKP